MPRLPARHAPRPANWAVIGIFVLLALGAISLARDFLLPVVTALMLFLAFMPLQRRLARFGIPSALTALVIVLGLVAALGLIVAALRGPVVQIVDNLPTISQQLGAKVREVSSALRDVGALIDRPQDEPDIPSPLAAAMPESEDKRDEATEDEPAFSMGNIRINDLLAVVLAAPAMLAQVLFASVLLYVLLASADLFYLRIVQSFDTLGQKRRAYRALRGIETNLGGYLGTITAINAALGATIGLAMWALGMPVPVMFAVLAFVLNFVPFLGAALGTLTAALVATVWFDEIYSGLLVGAVYLALTALEGNLITPMLVSKRMRLNTAVVFASIGFWAWLWSAPGMLIAVPLMVTIRVIAEHVPALSKLANFMSGETAPETLSEDEAEPEPEAQPAPPRATAAADG
ncbi:MAG: AI-2E family transporter [Gemmobacter sp.]